jgi:hypothetical protein
MLVLNLQDTSGGQFLQYHFENILHVIDHHFVDPRYIHPFSPLLKALKAYVASVSLYRNLFVACCDTYYLRGRNRDRLRFPVFLNGDLCSISSVFIQ